MYTFLLIGLLFLGGIAYADDRTATTTDHDINEEIKLINFEIPTTFSSKKFNIKYEDMEEGLKATVVDKKSKKTIATYSEVISEKDNQKDEQKWRSHLEVSYEMTPVTVLVYAELIISQKQGLKTQISSIPYIYQKESDITSFEIKNPHESIRHLKDFPTDNVILNITGQIYSTSNMNRNNNLEYADFKSAKFDMDGAEKQEWYARKDYNSQITFKLIQR